MINFIKIKIYTRKTNNVIYYPQKQLQKFVIQYLQDAFVKIMSTQVKNSALIGAVFNLSCITKLCILPIQNHHILCIKKRDKKV